MQDRASPRLRSCSIRPRLLPQSPQNGACQRYLFGDDWQDSHRLELAKEKRAESWKRFLSAAVKDFLHGKSAIQPLITAVDSRGRVSFDYLSEEL